MNDQVDERLKELLIEQLKYPLARDEIRAETALYGKGLGLDSVDVVSLIVRVENEFEIFFDAEEIAPAMEKFGSLLRAVQGKLDNQRCSPPPRKEALR